MTKSKKHLFPLLDQFFDTGRYTALKLDAEGISNETYGKDSRIYINSQGRRAELENFLAKNGFKVHRSYNPGGIRVEISVTYFRGREYNAY
jgi:hypothetical protein